MLPLKSLNIGFLSEVIKIAFVHSFCSWIITVGYICNLAKHIVLNRAFGTVSLMLSFFTQFVFIVFGLGLQYIICSIFLGVCVKA